MIKNYCIATILIFCCTLSSLHAMQQKDVPDLGFISTALFIHPRLLAIGSPEGCFLISDPTQQLFKKIDKLDDKHPCNFIYDKGDKLGVLYDKSVVVYDIKKRKKIWSQIIHSKNYSATFNHEDDKILVYQDGKLTIDKTISLELSYTGNIHDISISCHPRQYACLYPCSNRTLVLRPLSPTSNSSQYYYPEIQEDEGIYKAFFNEEGSHIAIQTDKQRFYVYYPLTKQTILIDKTYIIHSNIVFFQPNYRSNYYVIQSIYEPTKIYHYHYEDKYEVVFTGLISTFSLFPQNNLNVSKEFINLITSVNAFYGNKTNFTMTMHHKYLLLKEIFQQNNNYFLPSEILKIFIQNLYALNPLHMFYR